MKKLLPLGLALATALIGTQAYAASNTWLNTGSNASWSSISNWTGGTVPGNTSSSGTSTSDTATFNSAVGTVGTSGNPITIDSGRTIGGITFDSANVGSYTIGTAVGSNTLFLSSGGAISMTATAISGNETINAPLAVGTGTGGASYTIQNNSTSTGALNIIGSISGQTTGTVGLTLGGTNVGANTISGAINNGNSSALSVVKSGAGAWILSGSNNYSGGTTLNAGTLTVTNANGLGSSTAATAINLNNNGVQLNLFNDGTGSNGTIIYGPGNGYNVTVGHTSTIDVGHNTTSNTGNTIQLGSLANNNASIQFLSGNGYNLTFTGTTTVQTSPVFTNNMTSGTVTLAGGIVDTDTSGSRTITFNGTSNSATTVVGGITPGTGTNVLSLTQFGPGTLEFTGPSSYTGATTIWGGSVILNNSTGAGVTTSSLTLGGGALSDIGSSSTAPTFASGTTTLSAGPNTVSTSTTTGHVLALGALTRGITSGAVVNFIPGSTTVGANGSITTANGNTNGILGGWATVNGSDWATVSGSTIQAYSNYTPLTITTGGANTTNYSLTNTSLSPLTGNLAANSLKISDNGSGDSINLGTHSLTFGSATGGLLMTGGGSYTINGTGAIGAGTSSDAEFIVNVNAGSTLTINAPVIGTSTGASGILTKAGSGTLVLTASNSGYINGTNIDGGVLQVSTLANTGSLSSIGNSGNVELNGGTLAYVGGTTSTNRTFLFGSNGGEIDASGTGSLTISTATFTNNSTAGTINMTLGGTNTGANTISGAIANAASITLTSVTKTGAGTWVLSGSNSYTGPTTINNGLLQVTGSTAAGSTVTVNNGGALGGTGTVTGPVVVNAGGKINLQDGTIGTLTVGNLTFNNTSTGTGLAFDITSGTTSNLDKIAAGTLTFGGTSGITINVGNVSGTPTLSTGTYTLVSYTGATLTSTQFGYFSLGTTSLDGDTLSLLNSGNALQLVVSASSSATTGTYTLGTTAGASLLHVGATTTATTTLTNTGTGSADTLDYSGLGATATGSITGSAGSGSAIAQGATGVTTQTYTATTAGTNTLSPTVTSVTGHNGSGTATLSGTPGTATVTVYSGAGSWTGTVGATWGALSAAPANWTATGGVPGITPGFTTTDSATFGNSITSNATITLDGDSPYLNAITFNNASHSYTIAQGTGGTLHLSATGTNTATITDSAGNHTISAPMEFDSNVLGSAATTSTMTLSGNITESGGSHSLAISGPGTTILSGSNTYSGGTAVNSGSLLLANGSNGSATGSGALTVASGATIGGSGTGLTGTSLTSSFLINGNVIVGNGTDATSSLKIAATGGGVNGTLSGASLTFNLDSTSTSANLLDLGSTSVTFSSSSLTLNLLGVSVISPGTSYTLITDAAGFNPATDGLTTTVINGKTVITGGLSIANSTYFGTPVGGFTTGQYAGSFLYINGDNIDVEVVPEPSTYAMILGGLAVLVFWQRRRRSQ